MIGRGAKPTEEDEGAQPKGFDSFDLVLGDILRGERATMGKSLLDVQRELKIKAAYVAAIENCDPSAFDTPGFIAGYVRSYARYLGLDSNWVFETFCKESGFETAHGMSAAASTVRHPREDRAASRVDEGDIFAAPTTPYLPAGEAMFSGIEPRAIGSVLVLIALIGGIGYGGWTVLQEVQRVQLAPVEQPPQVIADVDPLAGNANREVPTAAEEQFAEFTAPSEDALDRLYRPQALDVPILVSRDAPISTLDPRQGGALADSGDPRLSQYSPDLEVRPNVPTEGTFPLDAFGGIELTGTAPVSSSAEPSSVQVTEEVPDSVTLVAVREAWVRVTEADGTTLFEGILQPGDIYAVPLTEEPPRLRIGDSGGVYFAVGDAHFGPVGPSGQVSSGVVLSVDAVTEAYSVANLADHNALCDVVIASTELPEDFTCE